MRGENHPKRAAVAAQREETMSALSDAFADDKLTVAELEERMATAQACDSVVELRALLVDLNVPVRVADPEPAGTSAALAPPSKAQTALAVLGASERRIVGPVDRNLRAIALLGAVELDLRHASFAPGVTKLHVTATLGAIEITVPPNVRVESEVLALLGACEDRTTASSKQDAVLRIHGTAVLGAVEVRVAR